MVTDADGGVVVVGQMNTNFNWGGRSFQHRGKGDVWVARYDASGRAVWMQSFGGAEADEGRAVAVSADSVYIAGNFQSPSVTVGAFSLSSTIPSTTDIFLARLDGSTGDVIWAKAFGNDGTDTAASVAAVDGGVLLAGVFQNASLVLDATTTLTNTNAAAGGNSSFLASFGADGGLMSATAYADMQSVARMVRDPGTGAVYFIGTDYVARLGSWRTSLAGSSLVDVRRSIAIDPASRYVFVGGQYVSVTITLGATTLPNGNRNGGSPDAYVARLDATTGGFQWARRVIGGGAEIVLGLAVDSSSVYAAGESEHPLMRDRTCLGD
jgi:hypothetical protein